MGAVVELHKEKRRLTAKRAFHLWSQRFDLSFDDTTCPHDLSDAVLCVLIENSDNTTLLLHELIMNIKGLGKGTTFHGLENQLKIAVTDIALFLLDQLRFEAMRRLGWVQEMPSSSIPLIDLVEQYTPLFSSQRYNAPELMPNHPQFATYAKVFESDRPVFIRRMIPEAIEAFQNRCSEIDS